MKPSDRIRQIASERDLSVAAATMLYLDEREELVHPIARVSRRTRPEIELPGDDEAAHPAPTSGEDKRIEAARDEAWNTRYPGPYGRDEDVHNAYLYGWDDAVRWMLARAENLPTYRNERDDALEKATNWERLYNQALLDCGSVNEELERVRAENARLTRERDHHLAARKQLADDIIAIASGYEVKTDLAASVVAYFTR